MLSRSIVLFCFIVINLSSSPPVIVQSSQFSVTLQGDVMLGGLVPVHVSKNGKCGDLIRGTVIQKIEMIFFVLDEINQRQDLLPNITLGISILDTCNSVSYGLEQSLEFVRTSVSNNDATCLNRLVCLDGSLPLQRSSKLVPIRGVVDGSSNTVTTQISRLLRLFSIPMISYTSTRTHLSDKMIHPYFARTLSSDKRQAKAMAALVKHFNWTYVSTVSSSGEDGIGAFQEELNTVGVCISTNQVISNEPTHAELTSIVQNLNFHLPQARVVVLYTRSRDTKLLLDTVRKLNISNRFLWVATDGWGRKTLPVEENAAVADGALTMEVKATPIPAFSDYFKALKPSTNDRNPWFKQYWQQSLDCYFFNDSQHCLEVSPNHELDSNTLFIYQAVYAFAEGLNRIQQKECISRLLSLSECIDLLSQYGGDQLYNSIISNTFDDGHGNTVEFDANGDATVQYNVYNYVLNQHKNQREYKLVAEFKDDRLHFINDVTWPGSTKKVPTSYCSEPCKSGEVQLFTWMDKPCCWICQMCNENQYVVNGTTCVDCKEGEQPTLDRTGCSNGEVQPTEPPVKENQSNEKDNEEDDSSYDTDLGGGRKRRNSQND